MYIARTDYFKISYKEPEVEANPGVNIVYEDNTIFSLGKRKAAVVEPIDIFRATVELDLFENTAESLKIGFVQTLVNSVRQASYKPDTAFEKTHRDYPVKDGQGNPWYKEEDVFDFPAGTEQWRRVKISTHDFPKFRFPAKLNDSIPQRVELRDRFLMCLVACVNENTYYFLHKIKWEFQAIFEFDYRNKKLINRSDNGRLGLYLINSIQTDNFVRQPAELKLDGNSANDSEIEAITIDKKRTVSSPRVN